MEANQLPGPSQSVSPDVWEASLARHAREWQLPLISLEKLGVQHDPDGFLTASSELRALRPGAEASPYAVYREGVVYKLFDLRRDGSLGKRLAFDLKEDGTFDVTDAPATLQHIVKRFPF